MKRFVKILMVLVPVSLLSFGFYLKNQDEGEQILLKAILENLGRHHYHPQPVDDNMSELAYKNYLSAMDNSKRFLLQEDVDALSQYKTQLDDQSLTGSYEFFDLSVDILDRRIDEAQTYYREILAKPFDFTTDETVNMGENNPYGANKEELRERWRKYLKYNVMTRLSAKMDVQEKAKAKDEDAFQPIPYDSLELMAREDILKNHDSWFNRMERVDRKDRLAAYVNSITRIFDPHTNYFPPEDKENFDIRMSGKLEGIGAQLQEKDGYIKVVKIIPGSPCALQGDLGVNDLILKVGQGEDEPASIVNVKMNDAVQLIRGKRGTEVRLTVQKPDGAIEIIPIIRDVVVLEETFAKSLMINDEDKRKMGYLHLPSFYTDFTGTGGRTCWKDVETELKKLEEDGAEALIFDLRGNGGGSLNDVVNMAGLFIEKGPIVQVKDSRGKNAVLRDNNGNVEWDKPVVVLVNEFSASASEIFAAALQDYNRAVIVGSHTTHGKGTVQRFIPLNRTLRNNNVPDLGSLKLTTQKFYRINGGATQLKGVTPDVILPDNYMFIETGEKEQEYALEWDKIEESEYQVYDKKWNKRLSAVQKNSAGRVEKEELFASIEENARVWREQRDKDVFTLNLETHRKEEEAARKRNEAFDELFKPYPELEINMLSADALIINRDSTKQKIRQTWMDRLKEDPYLMEALQISEDLTAQYN